MKFTTVITALISLAISTAFAAPTTYEGQELHEMSLNEANVLTKRYSCCSGGLAVNCGNCSTNGSGRVCCGNCCKYYTPPPGGQCVPGKAKVVPNPTC